MPRAAAWLTRPCGAQAQPGTALPPALPCGAGAGARRCAAPYACLPAAGDAAAAWASFDDFRWAALSVARVALSGGWWEVLSLLSAGVGPAAGAAFCLPLLAGALHVALPLLTALLAEQFGEAWRAHARDAEEEYAAWREGVLERAAAWRAAALVALRLAPPAPPDGPNKPAAAPEAPHRLAFLRASLQELLDSPWAPRLLGGAHAANLLACALVHAGMAPALRDATRAVNVAATAVFGAEVAARVAVLGPWGYCASWARLCEGAITAGACAALLPRAGGGGPRYGVSVLRLLCAAARLFGPDPPDWLARAARADAPLRRLLGALAHAVLTLKELCLVAFAYVLATAVLGNLCFRDGGDAASDASDVAAERFGTFGAALFTALALLTGANAWQRALWAAMVTSGTASVLFFVLQQLGSLYILALFNAALVRSFSVEEDTVRRRAARAALCARGAAADATPLQVRASVEALDDAGARHAADLQFDPTARARALLRAP